MPSHLPTDALPAEGDLVTAQVDGTTVTVTRVDGELFAFQDECTHAACSLADGEVDGRNVVCPCHAGTFDIATGAVVSGPPKTALQTWTVVQGEDGVELTSR